MATAEKGGATATTTANNSSYGGGGAGGKFRKKPLRRQATPYDRPPTVQRPANVESSPSWLTKLVVDPAAKLISYGANRFFGSLLRKRLPPPPNPLPPQQTQEVNLDGGVQFEDALQSQPEPSNELAVCESSQQEIKVHESSQLVNNSNSNGISDLAEWLKKKSLTSSEIDHLKGLLQSKAGEMSLGDEREKETASVFDRHEKVAVDSHVENRNEGIRSNVSTPIFSSKALVDDIRSPAELAKAYMGSRPSKVSPSMLGMHSQVGTENSALLSSMPFTSKSPIVPLTRRSSVSLGATENGFTTPRSRGRSAIYSMARTPYSRGHQTSVVRGGGNASNDFGLLKPSQRLAISEHGEKLDSSSATLKRRSSYLDDDVGSVGPIRRIRQKHNLLVPRVPHTAHGAGIGSAKNQHPLIGDASHEFSKSISGKVNGTLASTSHASVPPQSTEMASRILQHLEKLSPKEKSSESKLTAHKSSEPKIVAAHDKSSFKLTSGMLRGKALRSMEDVGTSKFMLQTQDDHKVEDRSNSKLPDAPELTSQNQEKVEGILQKESAVTMKSFAPGIKISDSPVRNGASQPPQKKRAFRMSAQEDSFELDDDVHHNGSALIQATDRNGRAGVPPMESNLPAASPKSVEISSVVLGKTTEVGGSDSAKTGEGSIGLAFPASEEAGKASQAVLSPPSTSFDKPKDNPPPLFSFSSKVGDEVPTLPLESSSKMHAAKLDSTNSFSAATPNGSQFKTAESDDGTLNVNKSAEKNVEPDSILAASNGPFGSKPPGFSFTSPSANNENQVSAGVTVLTNTSTSIADFPSAGTGSKSGTSTGSIFGTTAAPTALGGPVFKFGSTDPSSPVTASTANISASDSKTKTEKDKSFGSSDFTVPAFAATNSGSSTFGLASPSLNNLQGSVFSGTNKSVTTGVETVPQGSSAQSISSTSFSSTPFSSFSNSQTSNPKPTFQLGPSPASLNGTADTAPISGPPPSMAKFGSSSTTAADSNAISSNNNTSPGVFTFGLSSSTSTNTVGSTPAATSSTFVFGNNPVPAPTFNTTSSFGTGTSPFNFGGNSTSSSAAVSSTTSSSANVFGSFQSSAAPAFASAFPSTPSTGFKFGAMSTPATSSTPTGSATGPIFSFTTSTPAVFGTPTPGFGASPGNNDQMNAEDSMAEDPVQSSVPLFGQQAVSQTAASIFGQQAVSLSPTPLFGQQAISQAPTPIFGQQAAQPAVLQSPAPIFGQPAPSLTQSGFMFGQSAPVQQASPFSFGGQPNQATAVNPSPFQASGSLEFNAGGSFSLGTGGDKGNRRRISVSKTKNRKK